MRSFYNLAELTKISCLKGDKIKLSFGKTIMLFRQKAFPKGQYTLKFKFLNFKG